METLKLIIDNAQEILGGVSLVVTGLIAICLVIPGEQPEKALKVVADILGKFSRK